MGCEVNALIFGKFINNGPNIWQIKNASEFANNLMR